MKTSEKPLIVKKVFNTSIKNVWNAITDLKEMKQWFFTNIPDFKPVTGFNTEFRRESCMAGWEYFLGNRLSEYLHGNMGK